MKDRFSTPYSHPRWWWAGSRIPDCFSCAHFRGMIKGKKRCTAFPDGIPKELYLSYGELKHIAPYEGDHGIQYKPCRDGE